MGAPIPCEKDWIDVFAALLTPTIAVFGSLIAYLQWKINRTRLKHELFEKRWNQFRAIDEYLGIMLIQEDIPVETMRDFSDKTQGCRFVFGPEVREMVNEIEAKALLLIGLKGEFEVAKNQEERKRNVNARSEIQTWIREKRRTLEDFFSDYMQL